MMLCRKSNRNVRGLVKGLVNKNVFMKLAPSSFLCRIVVYWFCIDIEGGSIMQDAAVLPLPTWQNFYVIIGTAAATLTGLMFVVITLTARVRDRASNEVIGAFTSPTVVHFCTALL